MPQEGERFFRCVICGHEFHLESTQTDLKCPKCRSRALVLIEGESVGKKGGCAPSG